MLVVVLIVFMEERKSKENEGGTGVWGGVAILNRIFTSYLTFQIKATQKQFEDCITCFLT